MGREGEGERERERERGGGREGEGERGKGERVVGKSGQRRRCSSAMYVHRYYTVQYLWYVHLVVYKAQTETLIRVQLKHR